MDFTWGFLPSLAAFLFLSGQVQGCVLEETPDGMQFRFVEGRKITRSLLHNARLQSGKRRAWFPVAYSAWHMPQTMLQIVWCYLLQNYPLTMTVSAHVLLNSIIVWFYYFYSPRWSHSVSQFLTNSQMSHQWHFVIISMRLKSPIYIIS